MLFSLNNQIMDVNLPYYFCIPILTIAEMLSFLHLPYNMFFQKSKKLTKYILYTHEKVKWIKCIFLVRVKKQGFR